jgi:hypothetical protein
VDRPPRFVERPLPGFHHFNGATGEYYLPEIMGSGAGVLDYDGDGDLDVYLVQGARLDAGRKLLFPPPPGWKPGNRLLRNELVPSGALRFTDITVQARAGSTAYGMGVATADYDNDGDTDLYVTNFGPNALYRNDGGTFTEIAADAGVAGAEWSTSAAFLDYNRDGRLDLFVVNYLNFTVRTNKPCYAPSGERDYCNPRVYQPVPSRLYRNDGGGKFTDFTRAAGVSASFGRGLGVVCFDYDQDGWIDIYVANDGTANQLWRNNGDGTFTDTALTAGVAYSADGIAQAGMGVDAGDLDNDGDDDLFVANLARETNNLYINDGRGGFVDTIAESGMGPPSYPNTGFGTRFFDYDHDGLLDLFVANGAVTMVESLRGRPYPFHQRNQLFHNLGGGARFEEIVEERPLEVGRGAAFGDIDNDGDLDIVVSNNNGPARVLLNEAAKPGSHWLQVLLEGVRSNRQGLGARVGVFRDGRPALWRQARADASYLSAGDSRVHFGLGEDPRIRRLVVRWPDGSVDEWLAIPADRTITIRQNFGPIGSLH